MSVENWFNPLEIVKAIFHWFGRPRPEISFEYYLGHPENDYCQFRVNRDTNRNNLFFRLGINNTGKRRIEEADVRVEKIEKINRQSDRERVPSSPFFLHWANENTDNSRSIYRDTPVFVDFLYTDEGKYGMAFFFFKHKHAQSGIKEFLTPGQWIVTVKLLGNEIDPVKKEVHIDFNGKWEQLKMKLV